MPSLRRDGTALFYEDAKGREPPTLLVHGWGCDHTYLGPQFEHFGSPRSQGGSRRPTRARSERQTTPTLHHAGLR